MLLAKQIASTGMAECDTSFAEWEIHHGRYDSVKTNLLVRKDTQGNYERNLLRQIIREMEHLSFEERLRESCVFSAWR